MKLYKYFLGQAGGDWIEGYILARSQYRAAMIITRRKPHTWFAVGSPRRDEWYGILARVLLVALVIYIVSLVYGSV